MNSMAKRLTHGQWWCAGSVDRESRSWCPTISGSINGTTWQCYESKLDRRRRLSATIPKPTDSSTVARSVWVKRNEGGACSHCAQALVPRSGGTGAGGSGQSSFNQHKSFIDLAYLIPDVLGVHVVVTSRSSTAKQAAWLEAVLVAGTESIKATELFRRLAKISAVELDEKKKSKGA